MQRSRMVRWGFNLWNLIAYQTGWFACVLGAAAGRPWLGPIVVVVLCAVHITLVTSQVRELCLLALCGLFGLSVDSLQAYIGVFRFIEPGAIPWLAPLWFVALWVIFATTLHGCLAWLQGRYLLGALLGLVGGPFFYWNGENLGAIAFGQERVRDLSIVGAVWALATPAVLFFARLTKQPEVAPGAAV